MSRAALLLVLFIASCDKGELKPNVLPDTFFALEKINLSGENRLNSVLEVHWYGTDIDGYLLGFELSFDNQNWFFTQRQDTVFRFNIPEGSDTVDIDIWARSIDDRGGVDPTPAFLRVPLRNSEPSAKLDSDNFPGDTAICVTTYRWQATDPDGDQTITLGEMKWNDGDWQQVDYRQPLITFVADTVNAGQATMYYGNLLTPAPQKINGIKLNDYNRLYVRVRDLAGAYSTIDSSDWVYIRKPRSKFLVVSGQPQSVTDIYLPLFNTIGQNFDFLNYNTNNGAKQPRFWTPTFGHILSQFEKVFIYADAATYNSPVTGQTALLLNFMANGVQRFNNEGGKVLVSTVFASNSDVLALSGIYPIEDIVRSPGQARITNDSSIVSAVGTAYPNLQPQNILIGVFPIIRSADAEEFYRAQLTKLSGWQGDNLVASRRRLQGNINHVFFSVGLFQFTKNTQKLEQLFEEILENDFNW